MSAPAYRGEFGFEHEGPAFAVLMAEDPLLFGYRDGSLVTVQ